MSTQESQDQTQRLYATTDAAVWAREFMSNFGGDRLVEIDEGLMISWFANAIENAKTHEHEKAYAAGHEAGYAAGHEAGYAEASWNYSTQP